MFFGEIKKKFVCLCKYVKVLIPDDENDQIFSIFLIINWKEERNFLFFVSVLYDVYFWLNRKKKKLYFVVWNLYVVWNFNLFS